MAYSERNVPLTVFDLGTMEAGVLSEVGHRKDAFPAQLSGGEAQRVAIAWALDSERAGIVIDLLRTVVSKQQAAILAVTHDEKIYDRLDRIFQLRDGRLDVEQESNVAGVA